MVSENERVRGRIPELFETLMVPHLERVDEIISPGLTLLHWTSLNIDAFVESVQGALNELELLVDRSCDVVNVRIEGVLREIHAMELCDLPDSEPWAIEEFVARTEVRREVVGTPANAHYAINLVV